jgi:hypothetical protein
MFLGRESAGTLRGEAVQAGRYETSAELEEMCLADQSVMS